jgi:predicted CXXCH cytochrome family protein
MFARRRTALVAALALGGLSVAALARPGAEPRRAATGPSRVAGVQVVAGRRNFVTWTGSGGPYRIERSKASEGPWRVVGSTGGMSFADTPGRPGIYWYRVGTTAAASAPVSSDHVQIHGRIGPRGGTLRPTTGTVVLRVPPGAIDRPTTFTISQLADPPAAASAGQLITRAFDIGPSGTRFEPPATLLLGVESPTDEAVLPDDASVTARTWDETEHRWDALEGAFDADTSTVSARIPHLSMWAAAATALPHGGYSADTDYCAACHAQHDAPGDRLLLAAGTERETCYACHDGTTADGNVRDEFGEVVLGSSIRTSTHPVAAPVAGVQLVCSECHTPHRPLGEDTALLRVRQPDGTYLYSPPGSPIGNAFCYACHGPTSQLPAPFGDHSRFENAVHNTNGTIPMPASGSGIRCLACHEAHGSDEPRLATADQEDLCFTCHAASDPASPLGTNPATAFSAKSNDYSTSDGDGIRVYHHPIGLFEQEAGSRAVECSSCHNVHLAERDGSTTGGPIVDPGDTSTPWPVTWDGTAAPMTKGDVDGFCLECHVGPATTSPIAPGPNVPYTVRLFDDESLDADGTPHDTFTSAQWLNASGHGPSGAGLACTACHDVHGSSNAYLLREQMTSVDGTATGTVTGFDAVQADADVLASFCQTCHATLPADADHAPGAFCTQCHSHGAGGF